MAAQVRTGERSELSAPNYAARILLVDDEPEYGGLIQRALPDYSLDFAESYNDAMDLLKAGLPYDVAIVDLNLIGAAFKDRLGERLLAYLLADYPSTRRIALTGASPGSVSKIFKKYQVDDLLIKPLQDLHEVGVVVEAALARASGAVPPALRAARSKLWGRLHAFKQERSRWFDARADSLDIDIRDAGRRVATSPQAGHGLAELEAKRAELEARRASFDEACAVTAKVVAGIGTDGDLATASQAVDSLTRRFGGDVDSRDP
jgi:CheY-like chemotaxis protein